MYRLVGGWMDRSGRPGWRWLARGACLAGMVGCGAHPGSAVLEVPSSTGVVQGRVLGHDGAPLDRGHVRLLVPGDIAQIREVALSDDGSFELNSTHRGFARLVVSGVAHAPRTLAVALDGQPQQVQIQLGTPAYRRGFEELRLVVRREGIKRFRRAERRDDGRYEVVLPAGLGGVELSWASALEGCCGETSAGLAAEHSPLDWVRDVDGHYRWTENIGDAGRRVVFDPARLPPPQRAADLVFADPEGLLARVHSIESLVDARQAAFDEGLAQAARQGGAEARNHAVSFPWGERGESLLTLAEGESHAVVRSIALAAYFARPPVADPTPRERAVAQLALHELPPDDPAWTWGRVGTVLRTIGRTSQTDTYVRQVIARHPEVEVVSRALWAAMTMVPAEERGVFEAELASQRFANTWGGRQLALHRSEAGGRRALPEFELAALEPQGVTVSSRSLRGRPHLLSFWATWCEPCVEEMPQLHQLRDRFDAGALTIVSVAVDDDASRVRAFRDTRWAMPWQHAQIGGEQRDVLWTALGLAERMPAAVLIDEAGAIVAAGDPSIVRHSVEQLLGKGELASSIDTRGMTPGRAEKVQEAMHRLEAAAAAERSEAGLPPGP